MGAPEFAHKGRVGRVDSLHEGLQLRLGVDFAEPGKPFVLNTRKARHRAADLVAALGARTHNPLRRWGRGRRRRGWRGRRWGRRRRRRKRAQRRPQWIGDAVGGAPKGSHRAGPGIAGRGAKDLVVAHQLNTIGPRARRQRVVVCPSGELVLVVRNWQGNCWAIGERRGAGEGPHKLIRGPDPRSSQPRRIPGGPRGGHEKRIGRVKIALAIEDCEAASGGDAGRLGVLPGVEGGSG